MRKRLPEPKHQNKSNHAGLLGNVTRECARKNLFVLVESGGYRSEKWVFYNTITGKYLAHYFPDSRNVIIDGETRHCRNVWEAIEATFRIQAFRVSRPAQRQQADGNGTKVESGAASRRA